MGGNSLKHPCLKLLDTMYCTEAGWELEFPTWLSLQVCAEHKAVNMPDPITQQTSDAHPAQRHAAQAGLEVVCATPYCRSSGRWR